MKKKTFISIAGLSVIAALPISIISCANKSNDVLDFDVSKFEDEDLSELNTDTTKKLAFEQVANNAKNGDIFFNKVLRDILNDVKASYVLYYQKDKLNGFLDNLKSINQKMNSKSELGIKINNLNFKIDKTKLQLDIDKIIEELKLFKGEISPLFVKAFKNYDDEEELKEKAKLFDKFDINEHFYVSNDLRNNNDTQWKISNAMKIFELDLKNLSMIIGRKDQKIVNIYDYEWPTSNEMSETYQKLALFAAKVLEKTISRKIKILTIAKISLNDWVENEKFKNINGNLSNKMEALISTLEQIWSLYQKEDTISKIEKMTGIRNFYEMEKFETIFTGITPNNPDAKKEGIIKVLKKINEKIKYLPENTYYSSEKFNEYNFRSSKIWDEFQKLIPEIMNIQKEYENGYNSIVSTLESKIVSAGFSGDKNSNETIRTLHTAKTQMNKIPIFEQNNTLIRKLRDLVDNSEIVNNALATIAVETFDNINLEDIQL